MDTKSHFTANHFLNREISWLEFNFRVVFEATNLNNPLLERLKFLAISSVNLDEFIMVRIAGLKDQILNKVTNLSDDGLLPEEQLEKIYSLMVDLTELQQQCYLNLKTELANEGIQIVKKSDLQKAEINYLEEYFLHNIFPVLSPIALDNLHHFPFLPNLSLAAFVQLEENSQNKADFVVMLLPESLPRFIAINIPGNNNKFITIEEVVYLFLTKFFPGKKIKNFGLIRVIRDGELEIEDEAEDLMSHFESAVKERRRGKVIHVQANNYIDEEGLKIIAKHLNVAGFEIEEKRAFLGFKSLFELYEINKPELKFAPYKERFPERVNDFNGDCFAAIKAKDIVVHHPYETFDVVVNFLEQAAKDPNVVGIKQTLYRTSSQSPIVKALIAAAEAGKMVTVVVELKARFDEEANVKWARNLERVGAQVVFGFVDLKTHAKVSLVLRQENDEIVSYAHFGTGNYHPVTAKSYVDLSFFTCDKDICNDASLLFNYLTGYSLPKHFSKLFIAPVFLKNKLLELINDEIANVKKGKPGIIWCKMNALIDPEMIEALYAASQAGVHIDLMVRGVCALKPGIKGLSENIYVKSIVGRFLEHARIFCFGAGNNLPSSKAKLYIASADWMPRNFQSRVEVMVPIENPTVHEQIMGQILVANLYDEKQSWYLLPDGKYKRLDANKDSFSANDYFMTNPSLSGRGKALSEEELVKQREKIAKLLHKK